MNLSHQTIENMANVLKTIDQKAKELYKKIPGHTNELVVIGSMAQNTYNTAMEEAKNRSRDDAKPRPACKKYIQGMAFAAEMCRERGDYQAALDISRKAQDLKA